VIANPATLKRHRAQVATILGPNQASGDPQILALTLCDAPTLTCVLAGSHQPGIPWVNVQRGMEVCYALNAPQAIH
jgi:hypothetical protein